MQTPNLMPVISAALRANVPVLWWGEPGCGKTAVSQTLARKLADDTGLPFQFVGVSAAQLDPSDAGGIPFPPSGEDAPIVRGHDDWILTACQHPTLVLLDELPRAVPPVQNILLRLVQERLAGSRRIHPETRFIATGNPPETDSSSRPLGAASANRWLHVNGAPPLDDWFSWMFQQSSGHALVGAFLKARPELVSQFPKSSAERGGAWASRRSWANLASIATLADVDTTAYAAAGLVGIGPAREFSEFLLNNDLPDPSAVLADPLGFPIPTRMDLQFAVVSGCVKLAHQRFDKATYSAMLKLLVRLGNAPFHARDVGARYLMVLLRGPTGDMRQPSGFVPDSSVTSMYMPVLQAAGLVGGAR